MLNCKQRPENVASAGEFISSRVPSICSGLMSW